MSDRIDEAFGAFRDDRCYPRDRAEDQRETWRAACEWFRAEAVKAVRDRIAPASLDDTSGGYELQCTAKVLESLGTAREGETK